MKSATGRWVSGDDFFDRKAELEILERRVRDGNHILLTGQRRMGKTSIAQELGRRLETQGWVFLFADVEGASSPEDLIAAIAKATHPVRALSSRVASAMSRFIENIDAINAHDFELKFRAGLDAGTWRRHGERLFQECAAHDKPVLLVIDELPIFLKHLLTEDQGAKKADEFLSWLRSVRQGLAKGSPVLLLSGSIGLTPLVGRLGIPDRINDLFDFRLEPWDRKTSVFCFEQLAKHNGLCVEGGVANAVYETLGIGIPHHVQSFFAQLRDFATMQGGNCVTVADVEKVYQTKLLGPSGQADFLHYEKRLKQGLDDETFQIAMEILAEAATQGAFTASARRNLSQEYAAITSDTPDRISEALDVLVHDGYLTAAHGGHRFAFRLLRDWWAIRFRDHYTPLASRSQRDNP